MRRLGFEDGYRDWHKGYTQSRLYSSDVDSGVGFVIYSMKPKVTRSIIWNPASIDRHYEAPFDFKLALTFLQSMFLLGLLRFQTIKSEWIRTDSFKWINDVVMATHICVAISFILC